MENIKRVKKHKKALNHIIKVSQELLDLGLDEAAFDYIFAAHNAIPINVRAIPRPNYHDPDTTYREDTFAKIGQLKHMVEILNNVVDNYNKLC